MISLKEIDNTIKALQDMLEVWDTDELKEYLCKALDMRALILLNNNKGIDRSNDIFN